MDGIEFAALYTLQHGLAGHAETLHGLEHRDIAGWRFFHEPGAERVRDANAPRGPRCDLLTVDESVIEPTMHARGCDAEYLRRLGDVDQFAIGGRGRWIEARNAPVSAEIADARGIEGMPVGGCLALAIEYGGDHRVGMEPSETADQIDDVVVGADRRPPFARALEFDLGQQAGPPAQCQVDMMFAARGKNDDLIKHRAQQLLPVACRRPRAQSRRAGGPRQGPGAHRARRHRVGAASRDDAA